MKNTLGNQNVEDCSFAESMVSYMYDDIRAAECDVFEAHLVDCTRCTDEFAELSTARLAMFEWNRDEFAHLATPRFTNPALTAAPGRLAVFIEGMRGMLTPLSTAAAAVLVLLVTGVAFYLNSEGTPQVASTIQKPEQDVPTVLGESIKSVNPVDAPIERIDTTPVEAEIERTSVSVKAEAARKPVATRPQPQRAVAIQRTAPKPVGRAKLPVLSSFKDPDDKSLRLADLFDDIGG